MKIDIIEIGNSKGIRIPKAILEQCGLENSADMQVRNGELVITAAKKPRSGWESQAKKMAQNQDDKLPDAQIKNSFDEEWEW